MIDENASINIKDLVTLILDGAADKHLEAIIDAIHDRRKSLSDRKIYELARGDTITFNNKVRPKYLQGLLAEIEKVNKTTVTVKIVEEDKYSARRYGYGAFRTPVSLVEKVM